MFGVLLGVIQIRPVVMTEVSIGPARPIVGGKVSELRVEQSAATLFIPDGWKPKPRNPVALHFHSAPWYVVSEYQKTGFQGPVVVFNLGQGSTTYAKPFSASPTSFRPWLKQIEKGINAKLGNLIVSSFSAGYGAVRELIKQKDFLERLETVVMSDSIYGSFAANATHREVEPLHAACWIPLANRGLRGRTHVFITCSSIAPETYAGTHEVSGALLAQLGFPMVPVEAESEPAAFGDQKLFRKFERNRLHVWHYEGISAVAHMTQARHMSDVLRLIYKPAPLVR